VGGDYDVYIDEADLVDAQGYGRQRRQDQES
jgi:hypothetical protein